MRYRSTRCQAADPEFVTLSDAIVQGLAPDGGLYVPEHLPRVSRVARGELPNVAAAALEGLFAGDALAGQLEAICRGALSFPVPLVEAGGVPILELYHGPTAAFKDVGACFLAECMTRIDRVARTVLVATSGDTGGAVAAAFHRKPGVEVVILFPKGGVSPEQEQQLTCWGDNVISLAVHGVFDDCQRLLKEAMREGIGDRQLTTANSINIARLLPQMTYYAYASLLHGGAPTFVVPTGNVGNATAALWAKHLGFPVRGVVMATNANRTVPDYLQSGDWQPRASVKTLANAMDVGDPSNMERVSVLYPTVDDLRRDVASVSVSDAEIRAVIQAAPGRFGRVLDPHTATGVLAIDRLRPEEPVLVATAHAAKFESVVQPLVDLPIDVPPALQRIRERPSRYHTIEPTLTALRRALA